ncbi:type IV pilin [Halomicrobium sp. LC1Hm]|uniref:type IV pilin n=1 Tax=Halomicrobium sp. LC1Hm TaxID=2610902 RepID=UPI001298245D|nr:type IV pilin [Halomicrobium sp. LC1Hm]QGA81551.1 Pilin/Flagellin, FlaG/FlaF family [Halomicrobium sp. LC1Hm]
MDRATSPVVGVALLLALTVLAATAVGTAAVALDTPTPAPTASFSLTADAATDTLVLTHRGGDTVSVERLRLVVTVGGDELDAQPPVPFFAAEGFRGGPTGPFNSADDGTWSAGERGSFRLASTNAPLPEAGDTVVVRLLAGDTTVGTVRATAS